MAAITDLSTVAGSTLTGADYFVVNDSGTDKKLAASDVALVGVANTFTADQTMAKASPTLSLAATTGQSFIYMPNADNGNGTGHLIQIGRNSNGSTPAAGWLIMFDKGGAAYSLWVDDSGNLRILENGDPITANDGAGTVVGAQTSSLDSKDVVGAPLGIDNVLAAVQAGAAAVRRFTYKSGAYNGEEFSGVVTDYAPRYGQDRDAAHPAGKSLNEITVIGDLLLAVANLAARIKALEAGD